jgi:hypothetical protein
MKKVLIGILVVLCVCVGLAYFSDDHQRFLAFAQQRDAWHRRCDVYIGKFAASAEGRDCQRELDAMMAYAQRQGWHGN